ncbi:T9SS type A sorting domain-containing protein [Hanstruepera flava]|uniref:T9SS type A sorting domain-containing protein n=1 Tax=Hanstruepera flava TaxID=2930218 RepID=UPI002028BE61|nr:T9SS type A sorting domain-containing protein [Hanstruepera flava]
MKKKVTYQIPKSILILFMLLFFGSIVHSQTLISAANNDCGSLERVMFTNGSEFVTIQNGGQYDISDLPSNFYVQLMVNGNSESSRISIENVNTDERRSIIDNQADYTFPEGDSPWDLGLGEFLLKADIHAADNGRGRNCDRIRFSFSLTCSADAGTLTADMNTVELVNGMATISATPDGNVNVPDGYSTVYVLTQGSGLVIVNAGGEPSFEVTEAGEYTIHTLVYNPETLDLSIVEPGVTTGVDVLNLINANGICASLDVTGAKVAVMECMADAGTLTADMNTVELVNGVATISATPDANVNVPDGYSTVYVLTQGSGLVIVNAGGEPSFEVMEAGEYTIHTLVYNPETLDLSIVEPGVTTGVDVLNLINANGICASLDVPGAPVSVMECMADAGTLTADMNTVELVNGMATISATPDGNINVPDGYQTLFVLTEGAGLVIVNVNTEPSFEVTEAGEYTIHTLVYNPETLDLSIVEPGVTTGVDVLNLINANGICASLDVTGAKVAVMECMADAGTLTADMNPVELVNGMATISATPDGNVNVPNGYQTLFVLTEGADLVIVNVNTEPSFEVMEAGEYTIHTLVYNPETLDLSIVEPGVTTGVDVLNLINANGICASLDVPGAPIMVNEEVECITDAGTMYSSSPITCLTDGSAMIEAMQNNPANIPDGYQQLFVLTEAFTLTILNVSTTPEFTVTNRGFYRIHSLVYNPETLDLSVVVPGETTGFDVVNLINDNNICASLDVHGAINLVIGRNWFCFFFENYHKGTNSNDSGLTAYVENYDNYKSFEKDFIANNSEISLYPNPVVSDLNVNIQLFDDEVMSYRVTDVSGRQVLSGNDLRFTNGSLMINTNNLINGMYIISFESEYRTLTKKILVNR